MFLYTFFSPYFLGKIKKILLEKTTPTMMAGVEKHKQYETKRLYHGRIVVLLVQFRHPLQRQGHDAVAP